MVRNSENSVAINGATITVGDQSYTTDTYESLFYQYSNDETQLHNGFYMFEDLVAGQEYTVTFSANDFTTVEQTVTMVSNTTGTADENITWLDVELTSTAPAKIDQISISDASAVSTREPIVLTFSRYMDTASVEEAFSISDGAQVTLSWDNDYTLSIDISSLENEKTYQIKIDGSIAKNSQTQQYFDGDGDGTEGGDYTLEFTVEPIDETAPEIVSVDPPVNGESLGTYRPVIRVELSEELSWNEDKYADIITVADSDGNTYSGTLDHDVVGDVSVIHYRLSDDLPLDKCIQVSVAAGLEDFNGNATEAYSWKFLTEYRPTLSEIVVNALDSESGWWAPAGSGSSSGLVEDANTWSSTTDTYSSESAGCCMLTYAFDKSSTSSTWQIREYCSSAAGVVVADNIEGSLKFWLYGDGSNNKVSVMVRANSSSGGLKHPVMTPLSFHGWKQVVWDMTNDTYEVFTGTDELTGKWILDSFFLIHENTDSNPDVAQQAWEGTLLFDDLIYTIYDRTASRTASLDDMGSVATVATAPAFIYKSGSTLHVEATGLKAVSLLNMAGQTLLATPAAESFAYDMSALPSGIYIVKAETASGVIAKKILK